jgi:transcriptional regulator with XRE-family HTH domain
MATTGDRIKEVRESVRITQEELADKADLSKGFISDIENNKRGISAENLLRIADVLGASLDYLAKGETQSSQSRKPIEIPPELSTAAEQLNLTYSQTLELLETYNSVIARRSARQLTAFTVDQWKRLHAAIQRVFNPGK